MQMTSTAKAHERPAPWNLCGQVNYMFLFRTPRLLGNIKGDSSIVLQRDANRKCAGNRKNSS